MVNTKIFVAAGLAATASAQYTKPDGWTPCGVTCNPIQKPETGSTIEAGKPFEIKWQPSTEGTVTIYVCEGLSNNCQNQAAPIADRVGNTGSFTWVPPTTLKPSAGQGYGLQIIQDSKPSIFQWSGQFGVANSGYTGGSSSSASASASASVSKAASGSAYPTGTGSGHQHSATPIVSKNATSATPTTYFSATGTGSINTTVVLPTVPMTVPTTLQTGSSAPTTAGSGSGSQTTASTPAPTGAAGHVKAGMGLLFGGLVAALAL